MLIFGFAAVGVAVVLLLVSVLQLVAPAEPIRSGSYPDRNVCAP